MTHPERASGRSELRVAASPGGPDPALVRGLFRSFEQALHAREVLEDPGDPSYLDLVEKLRSALESAMNGAPDGLSVRVEGGVLRWRGRVLLGEGEMTEVCRALRRHGVVGLRFVRSASWTELARFLEGLMGRDFAPGRRVGSIGFEDLTFLSLEGVDRRSPGSAPGSGVQDRDGDADPLRREMIRHGDQDP